MIINSITLKNFKSYEDETTINLRPAANKNLVLIGGENGAGKSTLFEAIRVCFYGATAFQYMKTNYFYTEKVRNMICNNAFLNDEIETFVKLEVAFSQGTEETTYTLIRSWNYSKQKIKESFSVYLENEKLEGEQLHYFEEFLKAELPPSLFDFVFFDGEELDSMFTAHNGSELKNAVLQLLNYNSFELLRKQLLHYNRANTKSNEKIKAAQNNYDFYTNELSNTYQSIEKLNDEIRIKELEIEAKQIERETLYNNFKRAGGILQEERMQLTSTITNIENKRSELSMAIRDYCNDELPFFLLNGKLKELEHQVQLEDEKANYESFEKNLSSDVIKKAYLDTLPNQKLSSDEAKDISKNILKQLFSLKEINNTKSILGLSNEQKHKVLSVCNDISHNQTDVLSYYEKSKNLSEELKLLRNKLDSSVTDKLDNYLEDVAKINDEERALYGELEKTKEKLEHITSSLSSIKLNLAKAKNQVIALLQEGNISNLSIKLAHFLDELLQTLTENKVVLIEQEFITIFNKIIRKDNFIDSLKLDKNFNPTLYITKEYYPQDLINVIRNVGFTTLKNKYGELFLKDLFTYTNETEESKIIGRLDQLMISEIIPMHTKIEISSLSSGERQVYVLCLVWAILKVSNVDIPFIIDTPYARIDATHRNGLSTLYLPNISNQVIILSTNREIDQTLYQTIKPHICKEYLLVYNTDTRKTTVKNKYFEV